MKKTQQSAMFFGIMLREIAETGEVFHTLCPVAVRFYGIRPSAPDQVRTLHNGLHVWIRSLRNVFDPLFLHSCPFYAVYGSRSVG